MTARKRKIQKIRKEFENGDKNGKFSSVRELAKKYKANPSDIYRFIKEENWDYSKSTKYKPAPRTAKTKNKLNHHMIKKVEKFGGMLSGKGLATLLGITESTLIRYKKLGEKTHLKVVEFIEKNKITGDKIDILQIADNIKEFSKDEKYALKFILTLDKSIADKEAYYISIIEDAIKGYEIPDERIETIVDEKGKKQLKKIISKIHVKPEPKWAAWMLQHKQEFRDRYVKPTHSEVVLSGGDKPILIEEKNKQIDELMQRFVKQFPVEAVEVEETKLIEE